MAYTDPKAAWMDHLTASLADGSFVSLTLSRPVDPQQATQRVIARWVELHDRPHLSLTLREARRDLVRNFPFRDGTQWIAEQLGKSFQSALLRTTQRDWQLALPTRGRVRLVSHAASITQPPSRLHDRQRHPLLDAQSHDWLAALGIVDPSGRVRASASDKHRQIQRYVEILDQLTAAVGWQTGNRVVLADMGCGKGYLTFGVWHLLRRLRGIEARVIGVESRPSLVDFANGVARRLKADGLEFVTGTIAEAALPPLDGLLALHACDTATDDAILRGVNLGARLVVVAPCCHRELRPQLLHPEPFARLLSYGLLQERFAEWLTDGLRALFLEAVGYEIRLLEFVDPEHTPKNLLLAAVRQPVAARSKTGAARREIVRLREFFGIQKHTLDPLLKSEETGGPPPQPHDAHP